MSEYKKIKMIALVDQSCYYCNNLIKMIISYNINNVTFIDVTNYISKTTYMGNKIMDLVTVPKIFIDSDDYLLPIPVDNLIIDMIDKKLMDINKHKHPWR